MARIGIIGSEGRMGQAIRALIEPPRLEMGATERAARGELSRLDRIAAGMPTLSDGIDQGGDPAALAAKSDVLVDFSSPHALEANLDAALAAGVPMVIGTTGLEERHHFLIDNAADTIAVLQTGNTSLGVTLLAHLVRQAASSLGEDWDIEIVETHHRMKLDAPSGTALLLGEAAAEGRRIELGGNSERGRDGITGARASGAIGFASLRGGTVAGDHSVHFLADGERVVLSHTAENRTIFARGALRAALWLVGQKPGRYGMGEVLGL